MLCTQVVSLPKPLRSLCDSVYQHLHADTIKFASLLLNKMSDKDAGDAAAELTGDTHLGLTFVGTDSISSVGR